MPEISPFCHIQFNRPPALNISRKKLSESSFFPMKFKQKENKKKQDPYSVGSDMLLKYLQISESTLCAIMVQ